MGPKDILRDVLQQWAPYIRTVPHQSVRGACQICLGATAGWATCGRCKFDWPQHPEFASACDLIVPCSVAVEPRDWMNASEGNWYRAVWTYKTGNWDQMWPVLVAVLWRWLSQHYHQIATALDGVPDLVAVVPSRHRPRPTPLYRVVEAIEPLRAILHADAVQFVSLPDPRTRRRELFPDALQADANMANQRVLLVEDTWVSGATPLSTAIALRRAGAAAIALISIARMVYPDSMTPEYEATATSPIDFTHSPR